MSDIPTKGRTLFTLSSTTNKTDITLELADINQFEAMVAGHLNLCALSLLAGGGRDFAAESLRVDIKLTRPVAQVDAVFDASWYGPSKHTVIAEAFIEGIASDGRNVAESVLAIPHPDDLAVTYYVLVSRKPSHGDWSVAGHIVVQTLDDATDSDLDSGHFLKFTLAEQLRYFTAS